MTRLKMYHKTIVFLVTICNILPLSHQDTVDCYEGRGDMYRGTIAVTETGEKCLPWNLSPKINPSTHPQAGLGDHNYCRNPDGDMRPWCWTDVLRNSYSFCRIPLCTVTTCQPITQFQCVVSGQCITTLFQCDGDNDCGDNSDETTCNDPFDDNFAIVADTLQKNFYQIRLDSGESRPIMKAKTLNPVAVEYDPAKQVLYWSDTARHIIARSTLRGATDIIYNDLTSKATYDGISLDVSGNKLYYTDAGLAQIGLINLIDKTNRVILTENTTSPRAIVVHPATRRMYWTDWGSTPRIQRANMDDGGQMKTLIGSGLFWPNALAIDFTANEMYWGDAKLHRIEMSDLEGSNRRLILQELVSHFYGFSLTADNLYFTDWTQTSVRVLNRRSHALSNHHQRSFRNLMGIVTYVSNTSSTRGASTSMATTPQIATTSTTVLTTAKPVSQPPAPTTTTTTKATTTTTTTTKVSSTLENSSISPTTLPVVAEMLLSADGSKATDNALLILIATVVGGVILLLFAIVIVVSVAVARRNRRRSPTTTPSVCYESARPVYMAEANLYDYIADGSTRRSRVEPCTYMSTKNTRTAETSPDTKYETLKTSPVYDTADVYYLEPCSDDKYCFTNDYDN